MTSRFLPVAVGLALTVCTAAAAQWKPYTSSAGRFTVQFPGDPTQSKQQVSTAVGPVAINMFQLQKPDSMYMVTYSDYPPAHVAKSNPKQMLDGARDGAVKNSGGKLLSEKNLKIGKSPGRELKVEAKGMVLTQRMFLVKARLYQVVVIGKKGGENNPAFARFLNSFSVKQ